MKKSSIQNMPEYFDRYIHLADDADHLEALRVGLRELESIPLDSWKKLGDEVYAPGKWTLKDILQHCTDTERVFAYRALCFARGDQQQLNTYEEDEYAHAAKASDRSWESLLEEAILVRKTSIALFASFTDDMLQQSGLGMNNIRYSVLSIAFMIPGHQRWHFGVIEERYMPLLK